MKNSIKTTVSVILLGLASTAALANPTLVATDNMQSVQLTAQANKAIINTRGGELTGIYEMATSDEAPVVVTTTTSVVTPVAYEVEGPNKAIIATKGSLVSGQYEAELNRATTVKAMETKTANQVQPQASQEADSSNAKSLKN